MKLQMLLGAFILLVISYPYHAFNRLPWLRPVLQPISFSRIPEVYSAKGNVTSVIECRNTVNISPSTTTTITTTGGSTVSAAITSADQLTYLQSMTAGAISRTMAQVLLHPVYTYKTLLQLKDKEQVAKLQLTFRRLLKGADAQFLLSLPHGAFHFMVIDQVKAYLSRIIPSKFDFLSDFSSSAISTIICSIVSTPQMVITDRLMAGIYPTFPAAVAAISSADGLAGFYRGWWPSLAQKIPSSGLTWMFFQHLKRSYERIFHQKPNHEMNFILGAAAAVGSVTVMIPMDTIKTRLVIQTCEKGGYKGVTDCFVRMIREEGVGSLYRSLPPRLVSVVPMIAIQFGVYEFMKSQFIRKNVRQRLAVANKNLRSGAMRAVQSTATRVKQFRQSNQITAKD